MKFCATSVRILSQICDQHITKRIVVPPFRTQLMARNTDINRALKQGKDYFHHLPDGLRADPPHLSRSGIVVY